MTLFLAKFYFGFCIIVHLYYYLLVLFGATEMIYSGMENISNAVFEGLMLVAVGLVILKGE